MPHNGGSANICILIAQTFLKACYRELCILPSSNVDEDRHVVSLVNFNIVSVMINQSSKVVSGIMSLDKLHISLKWLEYLQK